jgi:hypothetical protein
MAASVNSPFVWKTRSAAVHTSGRGHSPGGGEDVVVKQANGFERLIRWAIGAVVLLLVHGFGALGAAQAGCNHLVTSQFDRSLEFNRLDDLIALGSPTIPGEERGQPDPRRPGPCSGPGCSSGMPGPAPTSASPTTSGPDQWVAFESVRDPAELFLSRLWPDEPAARPAGHKPSIFHPPPA